MAPLMGADSRAVLAEAVWRRPRSTRLKQAGALIEPDLGRGRARVLLQPQLRQRSSSAVPTDLNRVMLVVVARQAAAPAGRAQLEQVADHVVSSIVPLPSGCTMSPPSLSAPAGVDVDPRPPYRPVVAFAHLGV
jgi:hypothetical protein